MKRLSSSAAIASSPCINVCRIDRALRWCTGCGRTGSEIARWAGVEDEERQRILAKLPARLSQLGRRGKKLSIDQQRSRGPKP